MRFLSRPAKIWPLVACLCLPSLVPVLSATAVAADPSGKGAKKSQKDVSSAGTDSALENTLSWEDKVMGPDTNKKIDLKKIEAMQAAEKLRREKEEKNDKERKEREAAQAATRKDVAAPATHEVQVEEAPVPVKPAVKHDDAFVDKLLNDKGGPKKKVVSSGTDDVDQLLAKSKGGPTTKGKHDSVDQLLTSAEKEPSKTTVAHPAAALATKKSDEEAAREEALRAFAAAQTKLAAEQRAKQHQQPAVPDAAVLKARAMASGDASASSKKTAAPTLTTTSSTSSENWNDPFTSGGRKGASLKHGAGNKASGTKSGMSDPFDGGAKAHPAAKSAGKGQKKTKDPNWNDPFA